jgi:hypothetical protein
MPRQEIVDSAEVVEDQRLVEASDTRDASRAGAGEAVRTQRFERRLHDALPGVPSTLSSPL